MQLFFWPQALARPAPPGLQFEWPFNERNGLAGPRHGSMHGAARHQTFRNQIGSLA
jgi:hypothetical protein